MEALPGMVDQAMETETIEIEAVTKTDVEEEVEGTLVKEGVRVLDVAMAVGMTGEEMIGLEAAKEEEEADELGLDVAEEEEVVGAVAVVGEPHYLICLEWKLL